MISDTSGQSSFESLFFVILAPEFVNLLPLELCAVGLDSIPGCC